jgi:hypothetical protein
LRKEIKYFSCEEQRMEGGREREEKWTITQKQVTSCCKLPILRSSDGMFSKVSVNQKVKENFKI